MEENSTTQVEEIVSEALDNSDVQQSQLECSENADVEKCPAELVKAKLSPKLIMLIGGTIAALILIIILAVAFSGGGKNGGSKNSEAEIKQEQFDFANDAYNDIVEAGDLCVEIMDAIYGAWYFAIYESDDYSGYRLLNAFASEVGLDSSEISAAMTSLGISSTYYSILEDFSSAVIIVETVFKNNGTYTKAEELLASAKDSLKSVTNDYSDYTGYPTLKSYYSEVSSYLEFAQSPTGSFSQLKTTIDNYETNMRTYKNDLSFIFE